MNTLMVGAVAGENKGQCYGVNTECLPWAHVLNAWSPGSGNSFEGESYLAEAGH